MNKADLAAYLCNLHFLMDGQRAAGNPVSATLAAEYERGWTEFKDILKKEQEKAK